MTQTFDDVTSLPPHSIEAEESVLGALLIDDEAIHRIASFLRPDDFFRDRNRWVYEACVGVTSRNEPINLIGIGYALALEHRLEAIGGAAYLTGLMASSPSSVYVEHFANIVKQTAQLRRLQGAAAQITRIAQDGGPDVDAIISQAESLIFGLRDTGTGRDFVQIKQVVDEFWTSQNEPDLEWGTRPEVIATGYVDLDPILGGGLKRSDLVILAARPSVGKTSLALNFAVNAAVRGTHGKKARVAIFSLEMSKESLVKRMLASEANVDQQRMANQALSDIENEKVADASGQLWSTEIYIDDSALNRVADMRSKLRRLNSMTPVDMVIVDYLQLIQATNPNANRVAEVSDITRGLKAIARELDVPVIALSQLSRAIEQRPNHQPMLSDLRESGSIEQDADVVMFLSREDKIYSEDQWKTQVAFKGTRENEAYPRGLVDVIVAKHRNGPTDTAKLFFFDKSTRFANLDRKRSVP